MTNYPTGIAKALLPGIDAILSVRDSVGAVIQPVSQVVRTWTGTEPGDGTAKDSVVQLLPTPGMREFSQDVRLREGGSIKAGDIILTNISKNKYKRDDLDSATPARNIEKFFLIGDKLYQVINITEKLVTFNVQVREATDQRRGN